jgi:hypothetical protein
MSGENISSTLLRAIRRRIKVGCNDALDAGVYTFTSGNGIGAGAIYIMYALQNGKWLISSDHSSAMPEKE